MYTLYKFHFLNGISEINQLFDDILIIWPAPVFRATFTNSLRQCKPFLGIEKLLSGFTKDAHWNISDRKAWMQLFLRLTLLHMGL